jgi:predicted dehydrogenase
MVRDGVVGLGIVGLGRWANAHAAAAARSKHVELVNCFARSEESRRQFMDAHGVGVAAQSLEELIDDPAVDAVVVSSPNDVHASHVSAAIASGKPVLVDKPLSVDVAEGLDLWRASMRSGVPVGVAHHARRLAGHRLAREWVRSGGAGIVRLAHGNFSNSRATAMKPDAWHRSARGAEAGVLIQVGIHQVDALLSILGPVAEVNARFGYDVLGPAMPDVAAMTMTHAGGALSTVASSWTTPSHYLTEIQAEHGTMSFRLDHGHWTSGDVDLYGEVTLRSSDGSSSVVAATKGDPLRDQLDDLGRAVTTGSQMLVDVVEGLRAVAIVQAAVRSSAAGGAPVSIESLVRESGATGEETSILLEAPDLGTGA